MPPRKDNLGKRIQRFRTFDEEKIPEMLKTVEGFVRSRNTFTESEFAKFRPLFQRPVPLTDQQHESLEKELYSSISPFEPIRIVSDEADAEGSHREVLTLPPRLNSHNLINDPNRESRMVVDTFSNKVDNPNPLNLSAEHATDAMMQLVSATISDKDANEKNLEITEQAEKAIEKAKGTTAVNFYDDEESIDSIDEIEFDSLRDDDDEDELDFEEDDSSLEDFDDDEE